MPSLRKRDILIELGSGVPVVDLERRVWASAWGITTKYRIGKLPGAEPMALDGAGVKIADLSTRGTQAIMTSLLTPAARRRTMIARLVAAPTALVIACSAIALTSRIVSAQEVSSTAAADSIWLPFDSVLVLAERGQGEAQRTLGFMYQYGLDAPKNFVEAVRWYRAAADQGHLPAQMDLAVMYRYGWGAPQDYDEAFRWYTAAAEQGHSAAQTALGVMYHYGEGVPKDYAKAVSWYRAAAEQGDAFGQYALARRYYFGEGVPENYVEAVRWYTAAAEQGHIAAQFLLGNMYKDGEGVPENYVLAYAWYNLAAAQSEQGASLSAQEAKDSLRLRMTNEQVALAQELSIELLRAIDEPG